MVILLINTKVDEGDDSSRLGHMVVTTSTTRQPLHFDVPGGASALLEHQGRNTNSAEKEAQRLLHSLSM